MTHKIKTLLLLALLLPVVAPAETLRDAWASALASHQQIAAASALRVAADHELRQARPARLPQIGISTEYTRFDEAPAFSLGGMTTLPMFDGDGFIRAGAQFNVPLYTSGGITAGIEAAEFGAEAADGQVQATTQTIKLGTAEHFVAVLRAESAVDVAKSYVASLATHTEDTGNRLQYGAVPQNEYLAASVTLADAEQRLLHAENTLDFARASYNRFLGRPLAAPVSLDPALDIDNLVLADRGVEGLTELAQAQRPELVAMALKADAMRRQSDATRAGNRPQLALTGGYMFMENEFLDDDAFWTAGVSLQWNIFDGGRGRKQAAALDSRAAAIGHQRADLATMVALQVRQAWNDRAESQSRITVAERAVDQAIENLRVIRNRYQAGASTNVEVLEAEALREKSLSNLDDARYELVLAKLRLARATGSL